MTVTPDNDSPTISDITDQSTNEDTVLTGITFTIADIDTAISCAGNVSATSSNTSLIANNDVVF